MEGKVPFWGEGVRKKGQISLVKEQKSRELILEEGGGGQDPIMKNMVGRF